MSTRGAVNYINNELGGLTCDFEHAMFIENIRNVIYSGTSLL